MKNIYFSLRKNYLWLFTFFPVLILAYGMSVSLSEEESQKSEIERLFDELSYSFIEDMNREYQLRVVGCGGGIPALIRGWTFSFRSDKKIQLDEARLLYMDVILKLQNKINTDLKIRPYLEEFPIKISASKVSISFYPDSKRALPPYITLMFMARGNICYTMWDNEKDTFINDDYKESLSEAVEIYQKSKISTGQDKK